MQLSYSRRKTLLFALDKARRAREKAEREAKDASTLRRLALVERLRRLKDSGSAPQ